MTLEIRGSRSIEVAAPRALLWSLITDVTATARWSPHVISSAWVSPASGPAVGAAFRTRVRLPVVHHWTNTSTVTRCVAPEVFEFVVGDDPADPTTVWRYELADAPGGTQVTESWAMRREYRIVRAYFRLIGQRERLARGVDQTLRRLKTEAEAAASLSEG